MITTPLVGWDAEGNPRPTGIPALDDRISRIQDATNRGELVTLHHGALCRPTDPAVDTRYGWSSDQVRSNLVVYTDASAIRLGGHLGLTWACVALPDAAPLTIGDVALIVGVKPTTLNTWLDTCKPVGNPFPAPDWLTGLSAPKPIRLWSKHTIYIWYSRRPGRGYRSDRSLRL